PEKGIATLIEAVAQTGLRLVVAGTGPDETQLKQLVADRQAPVTFAGHVSGQALRDLIAGAKALVLPSEWYENAPVSILEAYALGRPVIGADIGGIPELIQAGATGLTSPSGNAAALAETLGRMEAMGAGRRAAMGAAGRDWASTNFSAAAYRDRMLDLYGQLVPA
ncbi:MAG TPA: glycosyltransferase family 4 protein, partial [Devosia sp.]|nr:glycosyltransferase family 4 protein [Devosia sp.]